jgi:DNA-3-methyladenine glycosylase
MTLIHISHSPVRFISYAKQSAAKGYERFEVKSSFAGRPAGACLRMSAVRGTKSAKTTPPPLPSAFFARDTVKVANDILGKHLIRVRGRTRLTGRIVEVEAYRGSDDPASHAYRGLTPRNAPMFGEPGHAYVYFTYGNHYCLNVTTQTSGKPGAVLIRAIEPLMGLSVMRRLRPNVPESALTNGPGKLTKALDIDKALNEVDMTKPGPLFIVDAEHAVFEIGRSARIGIKEGKDRLWRFYISGNRYLSRRQTPTSGRADIDHDTRNSNA